MKNKKNLMEIDKKIRSMRKATKEINTLAKDNPAVVCNISRISASLKMLELNVSDLFSVK